MAIDSAAKRKSVAAVGGTFFVGPVVVPDSSVSLFDRQVVGYGYGGIEVGAAIFATFVGIQGVSMTKPYATLAMTKPYAVLTMEIP